MRHDLALAAGPRPSGGGRWRFDLWAPRPKAVALVLEDGGRLPMQPLASLPSETPAPGAGWWTVEVAGLQPGERYRYHLQNAAGEGPLRPDPASGWQPEGVHGPSALVDHDAYPWSVTDFVPPPHDELITYELHVGTFTAGGTFDSAIERLDHLVALGVNAVELMPVAPCPGVRNWGYDGVSLFAVHEPYGGPEAMRRFVDACHGKGLAVILDVVYNHLGPEGNYLREYAPYFTSAHRTPWGEAVNFDGAYSDNVRAYVLANALHWLERYRVDGFRLDAVHAIHDRRPIHILAELSATVAAWRRETGRRTVLIAETHDNDPRLVTSVDRNGLGMDAAWSDDFHHAAHALLTGERGGFYADYGAPAHLADAVAKGFAYHGQHSVWRGRSHGAPADGLPGETFVIFLQTHDMVGNRAGGERLATLLPRPACRAAAMLLLLSPCSPLLFMGEEYGETNPFHYFVDHGDPALAEAVRRGRKREFKRFRWKTTPADPMAAATFEASRLDWSWLEEFDSTAASHSGGVHGAMFRFHQACITLRKTHPALVGCDRSRFDMLRGAGAAMGFIRRGASSFHGVAALVVVNMSAEDAEIILPAPPPRQGDGWRLLLDADWARFGGEAPGTRAEDAKTEPGRLALGPWAARCYAAGSGGGAHGE